MIEGTTGAGLSPGEVMTFAWRAWQNRDTAAALAWFAEDATYALCIPEEVVPFGGVSQGRRSISDRLQTILEQFDTLRYVPSLQRVDGETAHGTVDYCFRHKLTGEEIDGTMRHVARIRDGLIVEFTETHDVDKIRAFMRLVSESASVDRQA